MFNMNESGEKQDCLTQVEEELIDRVADEILNRYREAFEELAK